MRQSYGLRTVFGIERLPFIILVATVLFLISTLVQHSQAQVIQTVGPGSLGTQVNQVGKVYEITQGTRAGSNLFHSFTEFSVPAGNTALFLNTAASLPTHNVLSRVTGQNPSNIFGMIDSSSFPGANFFLMNPHGIVFGPSAQLNVGGAAFFTTADYVRLSDGALLTAVPSTNEVSLLTSADPIAFGFFGPTSDILVQGSTLSVADGHTLTMIGKSVEIGGALLDGETLQRASLSAPNGRISFGAASSAGEFMVNGLGPALNLDGDSFTSYGTATFASGSSVDVNGHGIVSIRGGQFLVRVANAEITTADSSLRSPPDSILLSNGTSLVAMTAAAEVGPSIELAAANVSLDGASIASMTDGAVQGGGISITGDSVSLTNNAQIVSGTAGSGAGGSLSIKATNLISITGFDSSFSRTGALNDLFMVSSGVFSTTSGSGTGGDITLQAPSVHLDDIGSIVSFASGDGNGGNIALNNVDHLSISNGARIVSLSGLNPMTFDSFGVGKAGDIYVDVRSSLSIQGLHDFGVNSTIKSMPFGPGDGGTVAITARSLFLGASGTIETTAFGLGRAGDISLITTDLSVSEGGGVISAGSEMASSGSIHIAADDTVVLAGVAPDNTPSRIASENSGFGGTGSISITAQDVVVSGGAQIRSDTFYNPESEATTPKLFIQAEDSIGVSGAQSDIRVANFLSDVGGMELLAKRITLADMATVSTLSFANGNGGTLKIITNDLTLSGGSQVSSASLGGAGHGGDITLLLNGDLSLSGHGIDQAGQTRSTGILSNTISSVASPSLAGNAGNITINAQSISISDAARIDTSSNGLALGNAGDITINAASVAINGGTISNVTEFSGNAGTTSLKAGALSITNSGSIISSALIRQTPFAGAELIPIPTGSAGHVILEGQAGSGSIESVLIDGPGSGIYTETQGTGQGGSISLSVNSFTLTNGGSLSARISGTATSATGGTLTVNANQIVLSNGGLITAETAGQGSAGSIELNASGNFLSNGGLVRTTATQAEGGDIHITAGQDIVLASNASVSASSTGAGDAGNITALAGDDFVMQNSSITTEAAQASGGNIKLGATDQVILQNSVVSASVLGSSGGGGDVNIDPNFVILQNSRVLAQAVQGPGGNIFITTNVFLADSSSLVDASSQFGVSGTVSIQSPANSLSGGIRPLPQGMLQAAALLHQRCAAQLNGQASSFVVAGRDALPPEPGTWLASALSPDEDSDGIGDDFLAEAAEDSETPVVSLRRMQHSGPFAYALPDQWAGCGS